MSNRISPIPAALCTTPRHGWSEMTPGTRTRKSCSGRAPRRAGGRVRRPPVQPSTCDALTIIFHGRRDLGTIQTYVAHGGLGAGAQVGARDLLRVPCDLDLGRRRRSRRGRGAVRRAGPSAARRDPGRRHRARGLARAARGRARIDVAVDRSIDLRVQLPAYRLMPVALVAPDRGTVVPVCSARRSPRAAPAGHRVRPAGSRARLPAGRGARPLPRGLHDRAPITPCEWPICCPSRRRRSSVPRAERRGPRPMTAAACRRSGSSLPNPCAHNALPGRPRRTRR